MKVPFVDLQTQYRSIKEEVGERLNSVMSSCGFILGDEVSAFEKEFAAFIGSKYCVGISSGTDALHLALREAGIGKGHEVLIPADTFAATALAVIYAGAKPVLADVEEKTFNIDCNDAKKRITKATRAIIPVHLYGMSSDMDAVMDLAAKHKLTVIEDACQSHGTKFRGKTTGTFGRSGCFSFYPGKNLGAYGDGGAVVTDDPAVADRLKGLRNYGQKRKYYHDEIGYNNRLDAMQAAVLRVKLKYLARWNDQRRSAADLYTKLLAGKVPVPEIDKRSDHIFHLYVIRVKNRDEFMKKMKEADIDTGIHYPVPLHLQQCFSDLGYRKGDFPVTERLADEIVSLPMYPEIGEEAVRYVCSKVVECAGRGK